MQVQFNWNLNLSLSLSLTPKKPHLLNAVCINSPIKTSVLNLSSQPWAFHSSCMQHATQLAYLPSNRTRNVASNSIHKQKPQRLLDEFDALLGEPQLLTACNMWQLRVAAATLGLLCRTESNIWALFAGAYEWFLRNNWEFLHLYNVNNSRKLIIMHN